MVQGVPQWSWNVSLTPAVVSGYPSGTGPTLIGPTKTGLLPVDLQNFVGIPLQIYGNPPTPIDPDTILQWIRYAEDFIEQDTGLLLCQTWVAAPEAVPALAAVNVGITVAGTGGYQVQGFDYDLAEAAYDFFFPRAQDEGWMIYSLRYRPVKSVSYGNTDFTAIKMISYNYPLLNEFFRVPPTWQVEDHDYGLVRLVPAANVQMLPLFAMQLAFMGFAESVPGAIWMQYTAGLTRTDYSSRFSFVPQLVLAEAARIALSTMQTSINFGALETKMLMDGVQYSVKYDPKGAFAGPIERFTKMRDELLARARNRITGPVLTTF